MSKKIFRSHKSLFSFLIVFLLFINLFILCEDNLFVWIKAVYRNSQLQEEKKYYKIVAPYDGLCITNSDSVHGYDPAGTSAAVVHRNKKRIIYAYFEEADVGFIREGMKARFRSNQYGLKYGYFPVTPFEVKKSRSSYGDKCFFLVKFRIDDEHHPLRIDSTGRVEIFLED